MTIKPIRRINTLLPVSPSQRVMVGAKSKAAVFSPITAAMTAIKMALCQAIGVFHQDDRIGDRTWSSDHRNCQRRDGDIAHVFLRLFLWHPYGTQTRLQHIIAQHEEQDAAHHSESVNGNAKESEQELTGQGKEQEDQKGREPASSGRLSRACVVIETRGHGYEYRHQPKWIDQSQKGSEGQQAKFNGLQ